MQEIKGIEEECVAWVGGAIKAIQIVWWVALAILVMRVVDLIWLVEPMFKRQGFPIHWMDLALPIGMTGVWVFFFARNLRSRPLLPLNDPFFKEAFAHDVH